jgi:RNA polymerase subunit RPABC4/transcription elongation factor Spt4
LLINRLYFTTGDKCATHHMYSLATDLYGLGIMKDPDAFKKPMLWLRFAKACKRCGRSADGLLAVKVRADRT